MSPLNIWQHIIYKGSSFRDSSLIIMDMVKDTGIRMLETLVWNLQMWILHLLKPCVATPCCSVRSCGWVEAPAAHPDGLWRDLLFGDLTAFTVWLYTLQYSVEVCTHLCQGLRHSLTAVLWRSKALHDGCLTHFCCKIFSGLSISALALSLPFPVYVCVCVCVCEVYVFLCTCPETCCERRRQSTHVTKRKGQALMDIWPFYSLPLPSPIYYRF